MRFAYLFFLVVSTLLMVVSAQKDCKKVCAATCPKPTPQGAYNICRVFQKACKCPAGAIDIVPPIVPGVPPGAPTPAPPAPPAALRYRSG